MACWGFYQMLTIQGRKTNCTGSKDSGGRWAPPALPGALPQSFPHHQHPLLCPSPSSPAQQSTPTSPSSTPAPHPHTVGPLHFGLGGASLSKFCSLIAQLSTRPHQEAPWDPRVSTFLSALGLAITVDHGRYQGRASQGGWGWGGGEGNMWCDLWSPHQSPGWLDMSSGALPRLRTLQ